MRDKQSRGQSQARMVNVIGGNGFCSIGGIQLVNSDIVAELARVGSIRKAFFLWDNEAEASNIGKRLISSGIVQCYGKERFAFFRDLACQALRYPNDVWLCMHVNYALLALVLSGWRRGRVGLFTYAAELDTYWTGWKQFALEHVSVIYAISQYTKNKICKLGVNPAAVELIHLGVADSAPPHSTGGENIVLFVGRMASRYKGQRELLDAMLLLRKRLPALRLVFAGGGDRLQYWKDEALAMGLTDVVEFSGEVSEQHLSELYRSATVFAMPSENEGFGLVYTEAMANGIPCICSNRDAACEIVVDGGTGFCVPSRNGTAVASAIWELLTRPTLRATMSAAARRRYLEKFTKEKFLDRVVSAVDRWRRI